MILLFVERVRFVASPRRELEYPDPGTVPGYYNCIKNCCAALVALLAGNPKGLCFQC